MKYSGIGGQAVLEGIMMKNKNEYAVAVRTPEGDIEIKKGTANGFSDRYAVCRAPFLRGIFAFVDSLILGMKSLMFSAQFSPDEDEADTKKTAMDETGHRAEKAPDDPKDGNDGGLSGAQMGITMFISILLAVGIFMVLPTVLVQLISGVIKSQILLGLVEGIVRLVIFIAYVALIARMEDIRRLYMYHGSEHKCINCIEHGLPLTVENVMKSSKEHKRCGTSFLLIVMLISILFFMVIRFDNIWLKILSRVVLIPVIAGISYEILRFNGRHDNWFVNLISRPGMWLQGLTTKEPEPDMVEVAIKAVEAVFDWKTYEEENFPA